MPHAAESTVRLPSLVLIVEDDPFIALGLEQTLRHEGYYVLGPAHSVASALALLQNADPDVAVLDFDLQGMKVTPVAKLLAEARIPFLLASGTSQPFDDELLANATNLGKPTETRLLLHELARLTGQ